MAGATTAFRTCPLCEATCGLAIDVADDAVVRVRGDADDVFSRGFLCPKGVAIKDLHEDPERLRTPLVKQPDGTHREATWDEAFARIAERLPPLLEAHGRDAVGVYVGNPNVHNLGGQLYVPGLLKALRTKNIFSASTVDQFPKQVAVAHMFGAGGSIPIPDLDRTDHLLMLGANPAVSNGSLMTAPDVRGRLKGIRARGGKIVVVDPRRTRTADLADEHVPIRPGTDALALMALLHVIFAEGLETPIEHLDGLDEVRALCAEFAPEQVAAATAIPAETLRRMARELAAAERAVVYGRIGTTTQAFGTTASWLIDVLNAVTGNLDRPGGALFPSAAHLPGRDRDHEPGGRGARFGRWTSRVRGIGELFGELPVACLAEEIDTPGDGQIRAVITVAGNPVVSTPNSDRLDAALDTLEFMVSIDLYRNETTRHADVILPVPSPLQRSHYDVFFTALAVRNVANYSTPVLPLDDMPDEWETLLRLMGIVAGAGDQADVSGLDDFVAQQIAQRRAGEDADALLAAVADRRGPERLLDIMLRTGAYGLTLADLEAAPHGLDLGPLEPRLPGLLKTTSGKVELAPEPLVADVERLRGLLDETVNGGLMLIGRRHLRSNNSWMHLPGGPARLTAQVNPADAERLGVRDGEPVRVSSRAGTLELTAEVSDVVMAGVVSIPHGWGAGNSNVLADETLVEPVSGTAVLNGIPVELAPVREPAVA